MSWLHSHPVLFVFWYALLTAVATALGAIPFAFIKSVSKRVVGYSNALAAGLMLGASFGLIVEGARERGGATLVGVLLGVVFMLVVQRFVGGHEHETEFLGARGVGARKMLLIIAVMTVHSFAEGAAVGVSFGGGESLATAITLAVAVHNIPEGLAISAVMRPQGASILSCAWWSFFSSIPQPLAAVPAFLFVEKFAATLPYGLGFAAGAMIFMVLVELLPEAYEQESSRGIAAAATLSMLGMVAVQRFL
ncbi:MAG: ZIP family metal transporter [Gemmatimonadaceae bacterium]|nr:ZIP family metal transporter [Gemmatimonadaceae bacterium]